MLIPFVDSLMRKTRIEMFCKSPKNCRTFSLGTVRLNMWYLKYHVPTINETHEHETSKNPYYYYIHMRKIRYFDYFSKQLRKKFSL